MNCIIGTNFSGISLLAGIANCSAELSIIEQASGEDGLYLHPITYSGVETQGVGLLNELYALLEVCSKFIWIVRHPLVVAVKHSKREGISLEQSFRYWIDVNTILWYFTHSLPSTQCMRIKFEDILLEQNKSVRSFCDFIGIPFSTKYLRYGDFPQPALEGTSFQKGAIDIEQVDPEPYDMSQMRETQDLDILATLGYTTESV